MPELTQTAVRVGDDILHTEAQSWGVLGIVGGLAAGLVVGVLLVGGTILTGGALAVVVGATLLGGGIGGALGKIHGSHQTEAKGKVLTGSPNVFIGYDKMPAARAEADVAHCEEHSDSESALDLPAVLGKRIAQGSEHVLINGHYAARKGDRGTCDFTLGDGWPTVVIGGPPKTVAGMTITSETASIDGLITGMMIVGGVLLMIPAAAAMLSAGAAAGVTGASLYAQVGLRLAGQFGLGYLMSKGGGEGMHYLGVNVFGLKEGSESLELMTFGGQVLTPFAGAKGFKAISDAPFLGGEVPGGVAPEGGIPGGVAPEGVPAGADAPRRFGSTGAKSDIMSTEAQQARANAAYDQIRANPNDVAQIAQNTGHSPETIQAVKDHLFNSQHDIVDIKTGQVTRGNFTADEGIAEQWNKAAAGTTKPDEITDFNRLIAHEYVEQGLVSDGLLYQHPDGWIQQADGEWEYWPNPNNFGAHDLSPNFREDPFSHYESMLGRSSEGIPRPNENYSNLDDVLAGVRRSLGEQGGPPEGGTSGPKGGGPAGGEKPFTPARPLPPNPPEGRPVTPAPEAEPVAVPEAAPGEQSGLGAAPELTEPLPAADPQGPTPEPAPEAAVIDPANAPDFTGRLRGEDVTLPGVKTRPLTYTKRPEADLTALRRKFGSTARFDPETRGQTPRPTAQNRSNFLKMLANDPGKQDALRAAGIDEDGIALMQQGKVPDPDVWQVHHKLPLDDGGTNASDNLVLIRNEPFHKVITNEQNAMTGHLEDGQTLQLPSWPIPDGFVYPPSVPNPP